MSRELTAPSERLTAAAQLAAAVLFEGENPGEMQALDVGCDHANRAIYLVHAGICRHVVACDINEGPVEKAWANVSRRRFRTEPLSKYIDVRRNDGLLGFENEPAERIFILGMGGDLIAKILADAAFLRDTARKTACILQAMTSEDDLRRYLAENGFEILKEQLVRDKGRIYSLILCRYDGMRREKSEAALLVGDYHAAHPDPVLFLPYIDRKIRIQRKKADDLAAADRQVDANAAYAVLQELEAYRHAAQNQVFREKENQPCQQ